MKKRITVTTSIILVMTMLLTTTFAFATEINLSSDETGCSTSEDNTITTIDKDGLPLPSNRAISGGDVGIKSAGSDRFKTETVYSSWRDMGGCKLTAKDLAIYGGVTIALGYKIPSSLGPYKTIMAIANLIGVTFSPYSAPGYYKFYQRTCKYYKVNLVTGKRHLDRTVVQTKVNKDGKYVTTYSQTAK